MTIFKLRCAMGVAACIAASPAIAAEAEIFSETFAIAEERDNAIVAPSSDDRPETAAQDQAAPAASSAALPATPARPSPMPLDLRVVASQFVDVPIAGDARSIARYSGRVDGYFTYNATPNFSIKLRPEYTWGKSSNGAVGLIPGNAALFRSEGNGDFDLAASLQYRWDSGATLEVGKMNLLDTSLTIPIMASNGHFGFQNLGIVLPPTGIAPNTITGAMLTVPTSKMLYRAWVFDPDSQYERTGFETAFDSGVAFLVSAARRVKIGGEPGFVNIAFVGSTRHELARDILPAALTPPPGSGFGNGSGEFAVQLSAYQYLATYPEAPGKGWGILARFQASAGDPTFLDYSGYFGVSGNPRFRPQDRFGLAYFQYSLTDELVDDIAFRLGIEDEQGVEAFYTYGITKGLGLTANVQVVDSGIALRDTGVTIGARITADF
ncbi:carbohydrate porin [Qipengyuania sp. ASV99]|uniref:carbohydrate porin n=1 Tax=Qipengyuania sp. ASV99 TaxID=3399681 RepID=UPI003A4C7534